MFVRSRLLDGMHSGPISIYRILRYSLAGWGLAGSIYTYTYTYMMYLYEYGYALLMYLRTKVS